MIDRLRGRLLKYKGRTLRLLGLGNAALEVYSLMVSDNAAASPLYQPGLFWRSINSDFRDLLYAGALKNLRDQYFNRRFSCPHPSSLQVYGSLVWLYYNRVREMDADNFFDRFEEPATGGNKSQVKVRGRAMSLDFVQSVEEAYRIRNAWELSGREDKPRVIVELGAGYGRLAYVCRKMMPDCVYVILDLPEALTCAHYWLSRTLPGEVVPYDEARRVERFDRETLAARRVWLLGSQDIEKIARGSVDAFVNVYSLAEMPMTAIENYFTQIERVTGGVFYSKQRTVENNAEDGQVIAESDYPVGPHWRRLYHGESSLYEGFFEAAYAFGGKEA